MSETRTAGSWEMRILVALEDIEKLIRPDIWHYYRIGYLHGLITHGTPSQQEAAVTLSKRFVIERIRKQINTKPDRQRDPEGGRQIVGGHDRQTTEVPDETLP